MGFVTTIMIAFGERRPPGADHLHHGSPRLPHLTGQPGAHQPVPLGLRELTIYKWVAEGDYHVRT